MAKGKKRKEKNETKKLRREVEILKAQLKVDRLPHKTMQSKPSHITKPTTPVTKTSVIVTDDKLVKKDLLKTFILSILAFGVIIGIFIIR